MAAVIETEKKKTQKIKREAIRLDACKARKPLLSRNIKNKSQSNSDKSKETCSECSLSVISTRPIIAMNKYRNQFGLKMAFTGL